MIGVYVHLVAALVCAFLWSIDDSGVLLVFVAVNLVAASIFGHIEAHR